MKVNFAKSKEPANHYCKPASIKEVFLTGAGGFIGSHILDVLTENNIQVFASQRKSKVWLGRGKVEPIQIDLTNRKKVIELADKFKNVDAFIHGAARVTDIGSDSLFRQQIFEATKNMIDLAIQCKKKPKFIYISTRDVYGQKNYYKPIEESYPLDNNPKYYYGKYKIMAEKYLWEKIKRNEISGTVIRPGFVWGPRDKTILPRVINFISSKPVVPLFGKGDNVLAMAFVKNVAWSVYLATVDDGFLGEAINIVDNEKVTQLQYFEKILEKFSNYLKKPLLFKKRKIIKTPLWLWTPLAHLFTQLNNYLHAHNKLMKPLDPSLYALDLMGINMNLSNKKMRKLFARGRREIITQEKGWEDTLDWYGKMISLKK